MKSGRKFNIEDRFVPMIKNGTKTHIILSYEEGSELFPYTGKVAEEKYDVYLCNKLGTKDENQIKKIIWHHNYPQSIIITGNHISRSYSGTWFFRIEEEELQHLLKSDGFKTEKKFRDYYLEKYKKALCNNGDFWGIIKFFGKNRCKKTTTSNMLNDRTKDMVEVGKINCPKCKKGTFVSTEADNEGKITKMRCINCNTYFDRNLKQIEKYYS